MYSSSKSKNNILNDKFDSDSYLQVLKATTKLRETETQGLEKLTTFDKLLQDFYFSVFKYVPKLQPESKISPEYLGNRGFVTEIMKLAEFKQLRTFTKLKDLESALATITLANKCLQELGDEMKDQQEQIEQLQEEQQQLLKLNAQLKGLQQALVSQPQNQKARTVLKKVKQQIVEAKQQQNKAKETLKALQKQQRQQVCRQMQNAMSKAMSEIQDTSEVLSWGSEAGVPQNLSFEEKIEIAERLSQNAKILKIARLLGKFKFLALSKYRSALKSTATEIFAIQQGKDIQFVLPSELVKLTSPSMKLLFYKNLAENKLLQYSLKAKEKLGRGDIVICLDVSGSMMGVPEIWAKAVALATTEIAFKQKRNVVVIFFDSQVQKVVVLSKKDSDKIQKFLEIASFATWGGTDYEPPLFESENQILQKEFKKADILFITDGICSLPDEFTADFLQFKKDKEVKVISILIGTKRTKTLQKFSDKALGLASVTEFSNELAGTIFEDVM